MNDVGALWHALASLAQAHCPRWCADPLMARAALAETCRLVRLLGYKETGYKDKVSTDDDSCSTEVSFNDNSVSLAVVTAALERLREVLLEDPRVLDFAVGSAAILSSGARSRTPKWLLRLAEGDTEHIGIHCEPDHELSEEQNIGELDTLQRLAALAAEVSALMCGPCASSAVRVRTFVFPVGARVGASCSERAGSLLLTNQFDLSLHPRELRLSIRECAFLEQELGFKTWTSAEVCAKLFLGQESSRDSSALDVLGRHIVELGCGTGLAGIAAGYAGAHSVVQTDLSSTMIQTAAANVAENVARCAAPYTSFAHHVLNWSWFFPALSNDGRAVTDLIQTMHGCDMVIAADVIYDEIHTNLVAATAAALLDLSAIPKGKVAFAAVLPSVRWRTGVERFESACAAHGFALLRKTPHNAVDLVADITVDHWLFEFTIAG